MVKKLWREWDAPLEGRSLQGVLQTTKIGGKKMTGNKDIGMGSFIANAIENKVEEESKLKIDSDLFGTPRITIIGCGGAGGNTIHDCTN